MFHLAEQDAWSVSHLVVGGSIYDDARSAAILGAVTIRWSAMRAVMHARLVTLSYEASSRVRIGSGTTKQTNTRKDLASRPLSTIPSTNLFLVQLGGFQPTGNSS